MTDKHPITVTTPPPLPTERAPPELTSTAALPPAGAGAGATEVADASQWVMSPGDRLLPDEVESAAAGPSRAMRIGAAAAVAVVAGVLLVEMVRRSPEAPTAAGPAQKSPVAVASIEPAKPAAEAVQPAAETKAAAVAPPSEGAERQQQQSGIAAGTPAALPTKREEPAAGRSQPQSTAASNERAKPSAPMQTGSLAAPPPANGTPVAPKVLNAPGVAGAGPAPAKQAATAATSDTRTAPAKPAPPSPRAHTDAGASIPADLPTVRPVPAARAAPPSDVHATHAGPEDRRSGRQVAAGPVVGEPVRSAPRAAGRDDYMAPGAPRADDYYARRPAPPAFDDDMDAPRQAEPPRRFRTSSRPLAPPNVDSRDPYQVRAMTVGLHPQTPADVLRRLSNADYRNADIAIQTAVAETPDGRLLVWPREERPDLATYLVRVGPGREPGCRRYVVKIEKDGRTVTTPEMETCAGR